MPDWENVKVSYGPCHKCGKAIEEPDEPVLYGSNAYHQECLPTDREKQAQDNSYT